MAKKQAKKVVKAKAPKVLIAPMTKAEYLAIASGKKKAETVGQWIRAQLLKGQLETADIVEKVKKAFKGSKTKPSDVYWNASQLRKAGLL